MDRRQLLKAGGVTAGVGALGGIGALVRFLLTDSQKTSSHTEQQLQYQAKEVDPLEEAIAHYKSADDAEKIGILDNMKMIEGPSKVIPVNYDYPWKGSWKFGNVNVGIEGRVGVYHRKDKNTYFEFGNEGVFVVIGENGKMQQSWGIEPYIGIPKGYSLLIVSKNSDPKKMPELMEALKKFTVIYGGELKISPREVEAVRSGIKQLGYYPSEAAAPK